MVSFLHPSQMRAKIAAGFKGKLLVGTLVRQVASGVDEYGDPVSAPQSFTVNGCVDEWSAVYKAQAGIPEDDSNLIIILGLSTTTPQKDDKITFPNFPTFQVRKVKIDPAQASAECQSYKV
jgi:hypothetical protein